MKRNGEKALERYAKIFHSLDGNCIFSFNGKLLALEQISNKLMD